MNKKTLFGKMTPVEIGIIVGGLIIGYFILSPVFEKNSIDPQVVCSNRVRQLATAIYMYAQDNNGEFPGNYPDRNWLVLINKYVSDPPILHCMRDANTDKNAISYAYNAALLVSNRENDDGLAMGDVTAPADVVAVCDAGPSTSTGGLICGTRLRPDVTRTPLPRHEGIVAGFCDGHSEFVPGKIWLEHDPLNPIVRSSYMASVLGLVVNPTYDLPNVTLPPINNIDNLGDSNYRSNIVNLGGEFCTHSLLNAVAGAWRRAGGSYHMTTWGGQYERKPAGNSVYGCGDGLRPPGQAIPLARDAVVIITAKDSKIPLPFLKTCGDPSEYGRYVYHESDHYYRDSTHTSLVRLFGRGYAPHIVRAYTYPTQSGTRSFFTRQLRAWDAQPGKEIGAQALVVHNDAEMVEKIAADPYGIGYCSSTCVDTNHVDVIAIDGRRFPAFTPQVDPEHRHDFPTDWPLTRTPYAVCTGNAWKADGTGFGNLMLAPGSPGRKALEAGPLFKASYYRVK